MNAAAGLILAALLAPQAGAQDKKDRVVLNNGTTLEGTVQKDTWKEVTVTVGASPKTVRGDEVQKIEYFDAPPAFKGAMAQIDQEKWAEANSALNSAEDYAGSKEKGVVKPRPWFASYLVYHRGLCQMGTQQNDKALQQFEKLRKDFKDSRFLAASYEATMQIHRERGDTGAMDKFEKEDLEQAPSELKTDLKTRAMRQRAELLYDKNKYDEAKRLFELLAKSGNAEIAVEGTAGVIRSLSGLKDAAGVETYCKNVLQTAQAVSLLLIASNALADAKFEKKDLVGARDQYIQSVVRFNPGRAGGIEREHERALYRLAGCYEALAEGAKDAKTKDFIKGMASSSYKELSIEYPSGKYREEAVRKSALLEPKGEEKKDGKK